MLRRIAVAVALATVACALGASPAAAAGTRPQVALDSITGVTQTTATFNARATTGGEGFFEYEFRYCPAAECPANTLITERGEQNPGFEENGFVPFSQTLTGLRPDTQYSVTLVVGNDTYWIGGDRPEYQPAQLTFTFRTAPVTQVFPTQAATDAATSVSATSAILNGAVVPGNAGDQATPASVWFEWGEGSKLDRTTPVQQLPAGGAAVPVSASLTGITPGKRYSFRVVATRNGARAEGAVRTFDSRTTACPAGTGYETVVVGRVRADGCFRSAGRRWVSEGEVLLNGLRIRPYSTGTTNHQFAGCSTTACRDLQAYLGQTGSRLYIDEAGKAIGTAGQWDLVGGSIGRLYRGELRLRDVDFAGDDPLLQLGADRSVNLFSLPLAGQFTFTAMPDGSGQLGVLVGLPVAFGGVTGESKVGLTPGGDVRLDGLRVEVGSVNLGAAAVEELSFTYDRASDLWRGAAGFTLPMAARVKVAVSVTVQRGRFNEFTGEVDNLNRHLAYGIFLQRIGVLVGIDPLRIGGSVGISAGPKVLGIRALGVDGSFLFKDAYEERRYNPLGRFYYYTSLPPSLNVSGTLSLIEIPIRTASATFYFTNYAWFELSGTMGYSIKSGSTTIAGLNGTLEGSVYRNTVSAGAEVTATILNYDVAKAAALVNTKGIAACGAVWEFAIGAYQRWGGSSGTFWACSMGELQAKIASASAAQAGSGSVALDGGPQGMIRFEGATAPPELALTGPGGRTVKMPPAGQNIGGVEGQYLVIRDPSTNATSVMLADPGKRPWRYETVAGSSPVRGVQTAASLPDPSVRARVSKVRRGKATLRWRSARIPGQKVTFTEEGEGVPPRVVAVTAKARGSKRFAPSRVPMAEHTIVATVEQDGRPRSREVVARFKAPTPRRVVKPRALRARRAGAHVTVRWRKDPGAQRYDVMVARRDGRRELVRTRRPRLTLRAGVRTVTVRAVGADGKAGPARTAKVRRR